MKILTIFATIISISIANAEPLEWKPTPKNNQKEGYTFNVISQKEKLHHKQFKVTNYLLIVDVPKNHNGSKDVGINIWDLNKFVCSTSVSPSNYSDLSDNFKNKIKNKKSLFYKFKMNPKYCSNSWLSYHIPGKDDDCGIGITIKIDEFIKKN